MYAHGQLATQADLKDEEKKASPTRAITQHELDFTALLTGPYTKQNVLDFIDGKSNPSHAEYQQYKSKIKFGLQTLRNAELLTRENQAAVIVGRNHARAVANALEMLDDVNITLSNEIRLALLKAGQHAETYAKVLLSLKSKGIINNNLSCFRKDEKSVLLSLNVDELHALDNEISSILGKAKENGQDIKNIVCELQFLNLYNVLLEKPIVEAVAYNSDHAYSVAHSLLFLKKQGIQLTDQICQMIARAEPSWDLASRLVSLQKVNLLTYFLLDIEQKELRNPNHAMMFSVDQLVDLYNANLHFAECKTLRLFLNHYTNDAVVDALKSLGHAGFKLEHKIVYLIINCRANANKIAAALMLLNDNHITLSDEIVAAVAASQYNADKVSKALVYLKQYAIELLKDHNIISIISGCGRYAGEIAETIARLHVANIPLTESVLETFKNYQRIDENDPAANYHNYNPYHPESANALLMLAEAKITITNEILTAITICERHAKEISNNIKSLHDHQIPLIKAIITAITPTRYGWSYTPTLVAPLIFAKKTHGDLLTEEILEAAAETKGSPSDTIDALILLKKEGMLTENILKALAVNHYNNTPLIVKALIKLKTENKELLTDEVVSAIIPTCAFALNMVNAILVLNSKKILISNEVLIAMKENSGAATCIQNAFVLLHEAGISLSSKAMKQIAKISYSAPIIAEQLIYLKSIGFTITDEMVKEARSFTTTPTKQFAMHIIQKDDAENVFRARCLDLISESRDVLLYLPKELIKLIATFFCYPPGTKLQIPISTRDILGTLHPVVQETDEEGYVKWKMEVTQFSPQLTGRPVLYGQSMFRPAQPALCYSGANELSVAKNEEKPEKQKNLLRSKL